MINVFLFIIIFLTGLTVGSFLNCVIYRLEKRESALKGRSYCPYCKHQLCWYDLIPILSFIILRGRCRYCAKKISWQYPLVELGTALLFIQIFNFQFFPKENIFLSAGQAVFNSQNLLNLFFLFVIAGFLIIVFVYDLRHSLIPDKVIYPAIAAVFLYKLFEIFEFLNRDLVWNLSAGWRIGILDFKPLLYSILYAVLASTFFLIIVLATHGRAMGLGDVKIVFLMGLFLGWPNIFVALFFAFLIGAIAGIGLILANKKTLKSEIPFGPFLVTGTFIAFFQGQELINWYLNLFI